jgi:hypothetical protein
MQVDAENIAVSTDLEEIRKKLIQLKTDKKINDPPYGLKGYGKFLPLLIEGPDSPNL